MDVMEGFRVGLDCTGRYMDVMEGFRVGLECTSRYMDVMEGFRVGLECTSRWLSRQDLSVQDILIRKVFNLTESHSD